MLEPTPDQTQPTAPGNMSAAKPQQPARYGRAVFQIVLMLAVLAGSYAMMNRLIATQPEREAQPFRPTVFAVESVIAQPEDNRPQLQVFGEVQAARFVELRPLVNGEVIAVNPALKAGSHVAEDDVLIEIDPFNYRGALAEARANLAQARATLIETEARIVAEIEQLEAAEMQLQLAENDLRRADALVNSGAVTQRQVEDRRLIVSQREQAVSQRRNNQLIEEARRDQQVANIDSLTWKVQEAERNLENTVLRSPFTGVINAASVEVGRYVSSSDVVASVYDDDALEVRFTLTDAQYGRISTDYDPLIGREIDVVWVVGLSRYRYSGTIERIGAEVASARGGVEVVARLDPATSPVHLRPGAFVEIDVPDRLYRGSYRIPESALYEGGIVYVIEDGRLSRQPVEIAAYDGEDVIIAAGLTPGQTVMTTHLTDADSGVRVRSPTPEGSTRQDPRTAQRTEEG